MAHSLSTRSLPTALAYAQRTATAAERLLESRFPELTTYNTFLVQQSQRYSVGAWYDDSQTLPLQKLKDLVGEYTLRSTAGYDWELTESRETSRGAHLSTLVMDTSAKRTLQLDEGQY